MKKYLLGGALYAGAKAFGANDKTANMIGAVGGGAEMFFNPLSGGADVAKYGSSFLNNTGVISPQAANAVGAVSSLGSKFVPAMMAYGGKRKKICAYGGDLFNEYEGASHEDGGIQISPVAETEGGENEYKGYIHSNRVKFDKNRTYADEASRIFNKYKKRLTDKLSLESLEREMKALEMHQEANPEIQKGRAALEQEYGFGGKKYAYGNGDPLKKAQNYIKGYNYDVNPVILTSYDTYSGKTPDEFLNSQMQQGLELPLQEYFDSPWVGGYAADDVRTGPLPSKFSSFDPRTQSVNNINIPTKTQQTFNNANNNPFLKQINPSLYNTINNPQTRSNQIPSISTDSYSQQSPIDPIFATQPYGSDIGNTITPQNYESAVTDQYGRPVNFDMKRVVANPYDYNNPTYSNISSLQKNNTFNNSAASNTLGNVGSVNPAGAVKKINQDSFKNTQLPDSNIPVTGALLNSIGPTAQLAGTLFQGADKTQFDRVNPQYVNYDPAVNIAQNAYMGARGNMRAGVTNNARSSGQLLSNMVSGDVALGRNFANQVGELRMNESNTNAGIANQAQSTNAQIQMQERIANEQNKAAYRQAIYGSLTDLGNIGGGYVKDNALLDAQTLQNQRTLNMLSGLPSRYTIDANGNIITK